MSTSTPPPRMTMRTLAQELGVSKSAVSAAFTGRGTLNENTRQKILREAKERGFELNVLAQNLSNGRTNNTIGIFALWLDSGVGTQKIQLIQGLLNRHNYTVPLYGLGLCDLHDESMQTAAIATIRRQMPRGLICVTNGLFPLALEELHRYQAEGGILICYDSPCDLPCDQVIFDREDNTYKATRHLLEQGHREIAYAHHGFIGREDPRLRGYYRALHDFNVESRESWLLEGRHSLDSSLGGLEIARRFCELKARPTAIVIVNDQAALVTLATLQREGVACPQNISIVGHDDHPSGRYSLLPITTASHPSEAIAAQVTEYLISRIQGTYDGPPRRCCLQGDVLVRQSTRPL